MPEMNPTPNATDQPIPGAATFQTSDVLKIRRDFPILSRTVNGSPLVYLDNAATTQKPRIVIDALVSFYSTRNSNINRGVHTLAEEATEEYENARSRAQRFIKAADPGEIVFVRGVTEAANLVAAAYGRKRVGPRDEIVVSRMEHHSNLVPWQVLCEEKEASLRVIPIDDDGDLLLDQFEEILNERTRLVAVTHVSNVLGTTNPIREIARIAHKRNIPVFVDGAQGAPHLEVDVRELGCDFYAFSGHKLYAPTGIGVLYGKAEILEAMLPYQTGGGQISEVKFSGTTFPGAPEKFEAGTPNIAGAIGLGAAIDYVTRLGRDRIAAYERTMVDYAIKKLSDMPWVRIIGNPTQRVGIVSFTVEGVHAHDVGTILDDQGIAIRSGHHCAQPLHDRLGLVATARASFAFYNLHEEIDRLAQSLIRVREVFKG
jgi:cysteine desulfurase/selenocysteine lyase